jgi:L-asparaginase
MKKILFITTGGTIASGKTNSGLAPILKKGELLSYVPEINTLCNVSEIPVCNIDSTNMTPHLWTKIAETIKTNYDFFDGFVICHGTDTMAYTSAALSYMIQNSNKPIILTGSQKPISFNITDAKKNIRDSVLLAVNESTHGVMIVFNGKAISGTRAKKIRTQSYDAFESINYPLLAQIQDGKVKWFVPCKSYKDKPKFYLDLDTSVFLLKLVPGMSADIITKILRKYNCLILESFGVGGIPKSIAEALDSVAESCNKKIVVLATQVIYEGTNTDLYEVGQQLKGKIDFVEAHDMTIEAVYTKMMWLLGIKSITKNELIELFNKSIS